MKKLLKTNLFCYLFLAGALLSSLSCGSETAGMTEDTTKPTETETEVETAEEITGIPGSKLEAVDYGGEKIRFILFPQDKGGNYNYEYSDVKADAEDGESVNDAVFRRNSEVMEKYNVVFDITEDQSPEGSIQKTVKAGDNAYDIGMPILSNVLTLGIDGIVCDLREVPNLDLSGEGWMQDILSESSINGKNYLAVGDVNLLSLQGRAVCMFSKELSARYDLPDFYAMVKDGTWTFDVMNKCAKGCYADLNGDGKDDENDQYGFTCTTFASDIFLLSSDLSFVGKDENDFPIMEYGDTERFVSYFTKVIDMINDRNITLFTDHPEYKYDRQMMTVRTFTENRALFFYETMAAMRELRKMDTNFGILPLPKCDAEQNEYCNLIHSLVTSGVVIPRTLETDERLTMVGSVLNDMAYASHTYVRPAYYESTVAGKIMRDNDSYEMLDYIFDNTHCSCVSLYRNSLSLLTDLRNSIEKNNTDLASMIAKKQSSYEKALEKIQTKIEAQA